MKRARVWSFWFNTRRASARLDQIRFAKAQQVWGSEKGVAAAAGLLNPEARMPNPPRQPQQAARALFVR
jgi:hypothetical protein